MITIIVLLILAGVTIATLTGDNGLLQKATAAKQENEDAKEIELIKLAVSAAQIAGEGKLTNDNLVTELEKNFGNDIFVKPISDGWVFNGYEINSNGNVCEYNLIPKEYQQIKYVESDGSQFINSRIYGITDTDEFEIIASYESNHDFISPSFFGWDDESDYFDINLYNWNKNNCAEIAWGKAGNSGTTAISSNEIEVGVPHKISLTLSGQELIAKIDDIEIGRIARVNSSKNQSHGIFARFRNNEPRLYSFSKIYSFKYYRAGKLIRDYIPCYSTSTVTDVNNKQCQEGTVGLYDTVEKKFYTNEGSTIFGYETEDGTYVAPKNN